MKRLDIVHHKFIVLCIILIVFISGILLGVKITGITDDGGPMDVILFALLFLAIVMLFLIFTQLVHLQDDFAKCAPKKSVRRRRRK